MRIEANGVNFHVAEQGAGEMTLVFLHYFGGSSRAWAPVIECLRDEFRCIAPDLRGFGASDAAPESYSVDDAADDLSALIESLQLERYVLVGHSMGGKIALEMAARQPRGLCSLILLAPSPPTPEPMEKLERERLLQGWGDRAQAVETLNKITQRTLPPTSYDRAIEDNLRSSRATWQAWLERGSREDISSRMTQICIPTSVVAGACDDGMTPSLLQREVVARVAHATFQIVPGVAHLLPLEAPRLISEFVRKWENGISSKSQPKSLHAAAMSLL